MKFTNEDYKNAFNHIIRGNESKVDPEIKASLVTDEQTALIPKEFKTNINQIKQFNKSLRQFVEVVPVTELKGTYATEDESNGNNELVDMDSNPLEEQNFKFSGVDFDIKPYGSFTSLSAELMEDTSVDINSYFEKKHAEKATKTENKLIFNAIQSGLTAKSLADLSALSTSLNNDLNPSVENEVNIIVNQDSFEVIKSNVKYFKDENQKPKPYFEGYPVEVYSNDELISNTGTAPFIYGSMNRGVKLFNFENVEVLLVKYPFGTRNRAHVLRGIERLDVKLNPGTTQLIYGEITTA